ncbi:MAG: hypothetical protein EOO27_18240 [Comamonadaceae bacterium]|nr:MAG: hypothetical protein EOO27_18240 [Comamonadaceae bacterium]
MELGWQLGMFTAPAYALPQDMTAANMQRAATEKFFGQRMPLLLPPSATREGECKPVGLSQLNCVYWLETGPLREEGRLIKFFAGSGGDVERIEVSSIQRWFGRWVRDL